MVNTERLAKGIYWDRSLKLVEGCTPVSEGCEHCWSADETYRMAHHPNKNISGPKKGLVDREGFNGNINLRYDNLDLPLHVRKPTVWAIWNDLFHEDVPDSFIDEVRVIMDTCRSDAFLVLTKRPNQMFSYTDKTFRSDPQHRPVWPDNAWLGTTVEHPKYLGRLEDLILIPGHKWVSLEPTLGAIDLNGGPAGKVLGPCDLCSDSDPDCPGCNGRKGIEAVVLGFESGSGARPGHPDWTRSVRDQCQAAGVPFFFKGWGEWGLSMGEVRNSTTDRIEINGEFMSRVGKKKAGRLLDGRTHDELPWYPKDSKH